MKISETPLPGVLVLDPAVFQDDRGYFEETYREERYVEAGLPRFVQDNLSYSRHGVLRGLHFQNPSPQAKLVYVLSGEIFDVAVDVRAGSPTFGQWTSVVLSSENHHQIFVPVGFAHGFVVTSESALVTYKVSTPYSPGTERTLLWNDAEVGISWPIDAPILAAKDREGTALAAFESVQLSF